jgi:hypothetical protein
VAKPTGCESSTHLEADHEHAFASSLHKRTSSPASTTHARTAAPLTFLRSLIAVHTLRFVSNRDFLTVGPRVLPARTFRSSTGTPLRLSAVPVDSIDQVLRGQHPSTATPCLGLGLRAATRCAR